MATTLTYSGTTLTIPDDMLWIDEFEWTPMAQSVSYSITGAVIIQSALKQKGRAITLQGGQDFGWIDRSVLVAVTAWSRIPSAALTLVLRGSTYAVAFDHVAGATATVTARQSKSGAVYGTPLVDYSSVADTDPYIATIRFIEV